MQSFICFSAKEPIIVLDKTDQHFDVLILGAGPAGTSCALKLAETNLKVALIDKSQFPRDKICGDALSWDVCNQLPKLSDTLQASFLKMSEIAPTKGLHVITEEKDQFYIPFRLKGKTKEMHICKRQDFDNLLFEEVKKKGNIHIIENFTAKKVATTNDGVSLIGKEKTLKGKIIIGADGAHSIVAKQLLNWKLKREHYSAGLRVYYKNIKPIDDRNSMEFYVLDDLLPGYFWIFPLPNNTANVGLGVLSSIVSEKKLNLREILQKAIDSNPALKERFKDAKASETLKGHGLPLGSKKRTISGDRFLLLGDAASLIDPLSGEGIGNAIRSGRVAGKHIKKCFEENNFSKDFNQAYDKEIYRLMWKELKFSRWIQMFFSRPWLMKFAIRKIGNNRIVQKLLTDSYDGDNKSNVFWNPKFLWIFLFR